MTTTRKTYRVLNCELRDSIREELQSLRAREGALSRPRVLEYVTELGVAERTVWRLAETPDADGNCETRTPIARMLAERLRELFSVRQNAAA